MTEDSGVFVQLRLKGGVRMGPGKAELLEHIADSGSISEAGRRMSMSYRRAWSLVNELNTTFVERVVLTKVGGAPNQGAQLSSFGASLLERYRDLQSRTRCEADDLLTWLSGHTPMSGSD